MKKKRTAATATPIGALPPKLNFSLSVGPLRHTGAPPSATRRSLKKPSRSASLGGGKSKSSFFLGSLAGGGGDGDLTSSTTTTPVTKDSSEQRAEMRSHNASDASTPIIAMADGANRSTTDALVESKNSVEPVKHASTKSLNQRMSGGGDAADAVGAAPSPPVPPPTSRLLFDLCDVDGAVENRKKTPPPAGCLDDDDDMFAKTPPVSKPSGRRQPAAMNAGRRRHQLLRPVDSGWLDKCEQPATEASGAGMPDLPMFAEEVPTPAVIVKKPSDSGSRGTKRKNEEVHTGEDNRAKPSVEGTFIS